MHVRVRRSLEARFDDLAIKDSAVLGMLAKALLVGGVILSVLQRALQVKFRVVVIFHY